MRGACTPSPNGDLLERESFGTHQAAAHEGLGDPASMLPLSKRPARGVKSASVSAGAGGGEVTALPDLRGSLGHVEDLDPNVGTVAGGHGRVNPSDPL